MAVQARRFELSAPDWIVELVRLKPAAISWLDVLRMAISIPTPLAVFLAMGAPSLGTFAGMGAMATALADRGGPLRFRLSRQVGVGFAGAVGLYVGHLAVGTGWVAVLVVAAASLVSALMSVINAAASTAGLQLLVYVAIASGLPQPFAPWVIPALYLVGALWALLLSVLVSLVGGVRTPEREAVAAVYRSIADLLADTGTDRAVAARQAVTDAMNAGYDALLSVRSRSAGRNPTFRELAALLNAATPVTEAAVTIAHLAKPVPAEIPAGMRAVAEAISEDRPPPPMPESLQHPDTYRLRALRTGMNDVRELLKPDHEAVSTAPLLPPPMWERLIRWSDTILTGPATWLYAMRLVLCMSLAEALRGVLHLERSYWILLTVAIVLKPDFGSVFARGVQRAVGTLGGVLIGAALLAIAPNGAWLLPFIAVAAGVLPIVMGRNYGMFAIFLTPLASLLIDFSTHQGPSIVVTRLIDTATGCAVALVFGYLLWPETWRVHLGPQVADAVDELADYLRAAFGTDVGAARRQRRRTYRTMSDVRTSFQRKLAEPPPVSTRAAAWWPMIVELEYAVDATTAAAIKSRDAVRTGSGRPPAADAVNLLVADVRDLAGALRDRRSPDEIPSPADEALQPIASRVRTARRVAAGPEPADRSLGHV